MRTFYISDIHGHYTAFMKLLDWNKWDPSTDQLIIGGDLINRGPDSADVLHFAKTFQEQYPKHIHVLCGNHEEMMLWYMQGTSPMWLQHGGVETLQSFRQQFGEDGWQIAEDYVPWLASLPLTYEDDFAVYTHAGINTNYSINQQPRDTMWTSFRDTLQQDKHALLKWNHNKPIFRGHSPIQAVTEKGAYTHCDLGLGVLPPSEAALALVDVTERTYIRCDAEGNITKHEIVQS
ncbi:metallophosphoesterase family protein [Microbacteriaceae bacterium 4G12]